jgi:hypothetical protein
VGAPPRRPALAMGRQWDFELPEGHNETSLWKHMDQVAIAATVATERQADRNHRNHAHPGLRLQNRKGGIMICRGRGWTDPNVHDTVSVVAAVTLEFLAMKRLAVCGLRLGRGPQ